MVLCKNPEYRRGLLIAALASYLDGDIPVGNSLLRDYLNGTQAFEEVAQEMQMKESGLRRMLSQSGNATANNLFRLFTAVPQIFIEAEAAFAEAYPKAQVGHLATTLGGRGVQTS